MGDEFEKYLSSSDWHIVEYGWDPERQSVHETLFTLANGYVGSRGVLEEIPVDARPGTFFAGLFDSTGAQVPELINAPNPISIQISVGGEKLDVSAMDVLDHKRILDMRHGLLFRDTLYRTTIGKKKVRYRSLRFFSMANPHVAVMQVSLTPVSGQLSFTVRSAVDTSVTNAGLVTEGDKRHFHIYEHSYHGDANYICTKTLESETLIAYASEAVIHVNGKKKRPRRRKFEVKLRPGQTAVITKYFAFFTSRECSEGRIRSKTLFTLKRAVAAGFDKLCRRHISKWEKLWQKGEVHIEGDGKLQRALRFNIYHLLSVGNDNTPEDVSIGARSLSGEGYRGHVFWDTEIFMLPYYIYTAPQVAKKLLLYRWRRLDAARLNAALNGYEGAMFPWESADSGEDVTPTWHKDFDGRVIEIHTMQQEHHITADIAYAVWQYYSATGDERFMLDHGLEMLFETARFWASRVSFNRSKNVFEIKDVIGPDEFHEGVDNNAFTNAMARWNLLIAKHAYNVFKKKKVSSFGKLCKKLKLTGSETEKWGRIGSKIVIHYDKRNGIIEQFEGFFKKKKMALPHLDAHGLPVFPSSVPLDKIGRTQFIKQADVVMLMYLLPDTCERKCAIRNYQYYERRTLHKSSLSPAVHAAVAGRLGLRDDASRYLRIAALIDLEDIYGNTRDGIHAASIGGVWQAVVLGLCGIRQEDGVLCFDPYLPKNWKEISFKLSWRSMDLDISVDKSEVRLKLVGLRDKRIKKKHKVKVYGLEKEISVGKVCHFPRSGEPFEENNTGR